MRDITLAETIYVFFTTRAFATGVPTVLAGSPVVSAYEDNSATQITAGITLGVSHDSVAGLNLLTIVATTGNGYEAAKDYTLVITTGTVGGVSVVGEVVGEFTIGRSAAATDLANGTDGLGALKTETAAILVDTGTTLQAEVDAIQAAVITNAAGADVAADIIALKAETAAILVDTATTLQGELDAIQAAVITNAAGTDVAADIIALKAETAAILVDTSTTLQAEVDAIQAAVITNAAGADVAADIIALKAETAAIVADTNELQSDDYPTSLASIKAETALIVADTNELQVDNVPGLIATAQSDLDIITGASGVNLLTATQASINAIETDTATTLQGELDAIQAAVITGAAGATIAADIIAMKAETALIVADTNELQVDNVPGLIAALNNISAASVNAQVVDVMRTDLIPNAANSSGTMPTIVQALYVIMQALTEHGVTGTTDTVRQINGSSTLATLTLNDAESPTNVTRAS